MSRILYFDCFSGCSGDMILGAMLDMGLPLEALEKGLGSLNFSGYKLAVEKVKRNSIMASKFNVIMDQSEHQPARGLHDILHIINESQLPPPVKERAGLIFHRLGEVEAQVHGTTLDKIHFHEIGAVDSIIDIVGACLAFDMLKIERFYASAIPVGAGTVKTAHGVLPVPAPATMQLLTLGKAPLANVPSAGETPGELVTPTGAAILTCLSEFRRPNMIVEKVGYGSGSKEFAKWPNVLRLWLGEEADGGGEHDLILLETNIDNMSPEIFGYLMEKLFTQGALDVWFTQIQMKKNRPAIMLSILAPRHMESVLADTVMSETTTLGIRVRSVSRHIGGREILEFDSSLGHVRAKVRRFKGSVTGIAPEFEDCRRIALEKNMPLQEVYRVVESEAQKRVE
jgi:pyridinium-3,5-bisthiocarboxylic acid mononucleotide nickel chelatase